MELLKLERSYLHLFIFKDKDGSFVFKLGINLLEHYLLSNILVNLSIESIDLQGKGIECLLTPRFKLAIILIEQVNLVLGLDK